MELSETTASSLGLVSDLSDAALADLLNAVAVDATSAEPVNHQDLVQRKALAGLSGGLVKEVYATLVIVLQEAARQDVDAAALVTFLEDNKVLAGRAEAVAKVYGRIKTVLRQQLARNTSAYPHVTDVQWRLDYYVKDNHIDKVNKLQYLINLKTEDSDGTNDQLQLSCTVEQLQDLVSSLKDASKAIQSLAQ